MGELNLDASEFHLDIFICSSSLSEDRTGGFADVLVLVNSHGGLLQVRGDGTVCKWLVNGLRG